ncbi:hemolysin D [Bosea sp. CRIB-10]|uniref:HlyD family type I secretion periplasmic adaptor subunit n=1 Tax=Bosea sp. CRIB-10 TaxID=378404 RepID=UPI0008F455B5|nr:HlyD family type I secretion periplasmic adaptor subunit [Bosea sp. CRIB-10]SFD64584.1 hemolysin D [Bosea sp. CRIB-10]
MNALVRQDNFKSSAKGLALVPKRSTGFEREDLEFLPAHLEILETPESPRASWMLWLLCGILAALIAWSWFAHLDIHAIAQGRIQPSGRSKILQPIDPGRVQAIYVTNGSHVKAGDLLIELDPTEAEADRTAAVQELQAIDAEIIRRNAALAAARDDAPEQALEFASNVSAALRTRQETQLAAELGQYRAQRSTLQAQLAERVAQRERLVISITARESLMSLLNERAQMRETLLSRQAGSRASVIDALQLLAEQQTSLAYDKGQLLENAAGQTSLSRRIEQLKLEFLATQTGKITDAERRRDELRQTVVKATSRLDRTKLFAPTDGVVQQLAVTTVGQVVTTGQPVLVVVPTEGKLEVEALIQNRDIAFVELGQAAVIKVDSLPFARYGFIPGVVRRISPDAVDERDAGITDAASAARSNNSGTGTGTSRVQNLVFPVTVELGQNHIAVDGKPVSLSPGMMVTVEIRTGSRRVIDYILAPLRETASQAGTER